MHTQFGEWATLGFFTRTRYSTCALITPSLCCGTCPEYSSNQAVLPADAGSLHAAAKADEPIADTGLYGAQRETQLPGHLAVTEPAVVGQHDGLALQCGQPFQALPEVLPLKAGLHCLGNISDRDKGPRRSSGVA